jgi:hypothetical protein
VWGTVLLGRPIMDRFLIVTNYNNEYSTILISILTVLLLALVLYFTFKFDWAKIIGKWFPWAIDNPDGNPDGNPDDDTKKNN